MRSLLLFSFCLRASPSQFHKVTTKHDTSSYGKKVHHYPNAVGVNDLVLDSRLVATNVLAVFVFFSSSSQTECSPATPITTSSFFFLFKRAYESSEQDWGEYCLQMQPVALILAPYQLRNSSYICGSTKDRFPTGKRDKILKNQLCVALLTLCSALFSNISAQNKLFFSETA